MKSSFLLSLTVICHVAFGQISCESLSSVSFPASTEVCVGTKLVFNALGTAPAQPFTYQWKKEGASAIFSDSSSLVFEKVSEGDGGNYYVVVKNQCGDSVKSAFIELKAWPLTLAEIETPALPVLTHDDVAPLLKANLPSMVGNEIAFWSAIPPATIDENGQTGNLQTGENVFKYTISHPSCGSSYDMITIKLEAPLGIDAEDQPKIAISPNPVEREFQVNVGKEKNAQVGLFTLEGIEVQSWLCQGKCNLSLDNDLPSGSYFARVQTPQRLMVKKVVMK